MFHHKSNAVLKIATAIPNIFYSVDERLLTHEMSFVTSSTVLSELVIFNLPISSHLTGLEADALKHHQIGVEKSLHGGPSCKILPGWTPGTCQRSLGGWHSQRYVQRSASGRERSFIAGYDLDGLKVQIPISLALRSIVGFCLDGLIMIHDEIEYHLASVTKMV